MNTENNVVVLDDSSATVKQSVPATAERKESRSITGSYELEKKELCYLLRRKRMR